jgi:hypothetical protein
MFICYDRLAASHTQVETMQSVLDHLFPSGHFYKIVPATRGNYTGGHSTTAQSDEKMQLQQLVTEIDVKYYAGAIRRMNAAFKCGGSR